MKLRSTLLAVLFFLCASPAFSQGCAMCRNAVAATTKDGQKAIGRGVAVLIVPPIGFMTLGFGLALRYGKKRDLENS
jgi:hypothetical protein